MNTQYTVGQLADTLGKSPDTLSKYLRRNYADKYHGQSWGASAVVPDTIAAELLGKSGKRPAQPKSVSATVSVDNPMTWVSASGPSAKVIVRPAPAIVPDKQPEPEPDTSEPLNVRGYALSALLIGIVLGHAGLVWYDCAALWGVPGAIAGGLVFAVVLAAVMLSSDTAKGYTAELCVYFVFMCDVAAFWVHKPVFSGYGVDNATTNALCAFVCATSFAALYIFKSYKND